MAITYPSATFNFMLFLQQSSSISPSPLNSSSANASAISGRGLAARDRVIDFGKHKGKMLGTLPSTYLKWVSKNLRARDFEEWAQLADQVLEDPVYKDRIEWESAQNVLNGDVLRSSFSSSSPVGELAEISERFGWDFEDKAGWAEVDFELLGTSKGGRLPRLNDFGLRPNEMGSDPTLKTPKGSISSLSSSGSKPVRDVGEKRRERIQRRKSSLKEDKRDSRVIFGNSSEVVSETKGGGGGGKCDKEESRRTNIDKSSFPGREALIKKVLKTRGQ